MEIGNLEYISTVGHTEDLNTGLIGTYGYILDGGEIPDETTDYSGLMVDLLLEQFRREQV